MLRLQEAGAVRRKYLLFRQKELDRQSIHPEHLNQKYELLLP
ncbi:hypothetical protein ACLM45_11715 [Synechococcus sp. A10-1-5-9]